MLLACPACDRRHDVTGCASGEKLRCGCGATMTLASIPTPAELVSTRADPLPCPRCTGMLRVRPVSDIAIHECGDCRGVFLDQATVRQVVVEHTPSRAEALLGVLSRAAVNPVPAAGQKMYVQCPVCRAMMNRRLYAAGSGMIVDVCRAHGTFFDAGELPLAIELVKSGGLRRAPREHPAPPPPAAGHEAVKHDHAPFQPQPELPVARVHKISSRGTGGAGRGQPAVSSPDGTGALDVIGAFVALLGTLFDD